MRVLSTGKQATCFMKADERTSGEAERGILDTKVTKRAAILQISSHEKDQEAQSGQVRCGVLLCSAMRRPSLHFILCMFIVLDPAKNPSHAVE